jgi:hypothetical protein
MSKEVKKKKINPLEFLIGHYLDGDYFDLVTE